MQPTLIRILIPLPIVPFLVRHAVSPKVVVVVIFVRRSKPLGSFTNCVKIASNCVSPYSASHNFHTYRLNMGTASKTTMEDNSADSVFASWHVAVYLSMNHCCVLSLYYCDIMFRLSIFLCCRFPGLQLMQGTILCKPVSVQ